MRKKLKRLGFRGGLRFKGSLRSRFWFKEWEGRERCKEEWVMRVEEES